MHIYLWSILCFEKKDWTDLGREMAVAPVPQGERGSVRPVRLGSRQALLGTGRAKRGRENAEMILLHC